MCINFCYTAYVNTQHPLTIVIFGATGNLYADKLAKALFLLYEQYKVLPGDFKIIAFARKDFTSEAFRAMTKDHILKRGEVNNHILDEFVSHIDYFQGDFSTVHDFIKLKTVLASEDNMRTIFHLATASFLYDIIFENMRTAELHTLRGEVRLMIEKPFGVNEIDAKCLRDKLDTFLSRECVFNIDHYLAKETVREITDFRFVNGSLESRWDSQHISKIKIIFYESNIVGSRGASYDTAGAFRDVGENHMLEILALIVMHKPPHSDATSTRDSRAKALQGLYIDEAKKITKGQYESYLASPGVQANSKTETFFRIFLKSKDPIFTDVEFELESGKGLVDRGSSVTTTTVGVHIYFKNGEVKEFNIQPVPGTMYDSYTKVYTDAIHGDQTLFVSMDEIMAEWKLADELLEKWKDIPLSIYKDGARPEDIISQ